MWQRNLGVPVPLPKLPCGNIDPLGITGTPVIDERSGALYLDAMLGGPAGPGLTVAVRFPAAKERP